MKRVGWDCNADRPPVQSSIPCAVEKRAQGATVGQSEESDLNDAVPAGYGSVSHVRPPSSLRKRAGAGSYGAPTTSTFAPSGLARICSTEWLPRLKVGRQRLPPSVVTNSSATT